MAQSISNKVKAFQRELARYYEATDYQDLLEVDTTIIGWGGNVSYTVLKTVIYRTEIEHDGHKFEERFRLRSPMDVMELEEQLKHDRRRLGKSWRVWKAENPDMELEKDDNDEE